MLNNEMKIIMTQLRLTLYRKWFEMWQTGEKPEDYRDITPYWCKRLLTNEALNMLHLNTAVPVLVRDLQRLYEKYGTQIFKEFDSLVLTLGYPRKGDKSRIMTAGCPFIYLGQGREEWGAVSGRTYFIIRGLPF